MDKVINILKDYNTTKTQAKNLVRDMSKNREITQEEKKTLNEYIDTYFVDKDILKRSYRIGDNIFRKRKRNFRYNYLISDNFFVDLYEDNSRTTNITEIFPENSYITKGTKKNKKVMELRRKFRDKLDYYVELVNNGYVYGILKSDEIPEREFIRISKGLMFYKAYIDTNYNNFPRIFEYEDFEYIINSYKQEERGLSNDGIIINIPFTYRKGEKENYTLIKTFSGLIVNLDVIMDDIEEFIINESLVYNGDPLIPLDTSLIEFLIVFAPRGGCLDYFKDNLAANLLNTLVSQKKYNIYSPKPNAENNCFFSCLSKIDKKIFKDLCKTNGYKQSIARNLKTVFNMKRKDMVDIKKAEEILIEIEKIREGFGEIIEIESDIFLFIDKCVNSDITKHTLVCFNNHWLVCSPREYKIKEETYKPRKDEKIYKEKNIVFYDIETKTRSGLDEDQKFFVHKNSVIGYVYDGEEFNYCINFANLLDLLTQEFDEQNELEIILCSYNGSRYDDYFLLKECLDLENFKLLSFGFDNGRLAGLRFTYNDRLFSTFDLARHCVGKLGDMLEDFGCINQKDNIDYDIIDDFFEMCEEDRNNLLVYLEFDVLGLQELYHKLSSTIIEAINEINTGLETEIVDIDNFYLYNFVSTSQLTYELWIRSYYAELKNKGLGKEYHLYKPFHLQQGHIIQDSVYGGRTQVFKKEHKPNKKVLEILNEIKNFDYGLDLENKPHYKIYNTSLVKRLQDVITNNDKIYDLDVNSEYPYLMMREEYPVGMPDFITCYDLSTSMDVIEMMRAGRIGFFQCKVRFNKRKLNGLILSPHPRRVNGGLSWDLIDRDQCLNSTDILRLIDNGASVILIKGYLYKYKYKVFEFYEGITTSMKIKYADNNSIKTVSKNLSNCLFGKQFQKPRNSSEEILSVENTERLYDIIKNNELENIELRINYKIVDDVINENFNVITHSTNYTKFEKSNIYIKRKGPIKIFHYTKPNYLGSMVLGYTRDFLWGVFEILDCLRNPNNLPFYMDTDSIHITYEQYKMFISRKMLSESAIGKFKNDMYKFRDTITDDEYENYDVIDKECYIIRGLFPGLKFYIDIGISNHKNKENYIFLHKKSKGIESKNLTYNDYLNLCAGSELNVKYQSIFNRKNMQVSKGEKEKGISHLDIYGWTDSKQKTFKHNPRNCLITPDEKYGEIYTALTNPY